MKYDVIFTGRSGVVNLEVHRLDRFQGYLIDKSNICLYKCHP